MAAVTYQVQGRSWRLRLLAAVAVAWALIVLLAAYASAGHDAPTVRDQTSVSQAQPALDRAVAGLVAAAGPDVVVEVYPFIRVGTCRISVVRDGEEWEQAVLFHTRAAAEPALLDRLAAKLPPEYAARAMHLTGDRHELHADAGDYVRLSGGREAAGGVRVVASTGCRTGTADVGGRTREGEPAARLRAPVEPALAALAIRPEHWTTLEVPCADGGALRVTTAQGARGAAPGPLGTALLPVGPDAVVAQDDLYAYRVGESSVVARRQDDAVALTVTTPCERQ